MTIEAIRQRLNDLTLECGFSPLVVAGRAFDGDVWGVMVNVAAPQDVCHVKIYDFGADEILIQFSSVPISLARPFGQTKEDALLLMRRNGKQSEGFWRFGYEHPADCQQFVILEDLTMLNAAKFYDAAIRVVTEDQWWHDILEERARTWAEEPWE